MEWTYKVKCRCCNKITKMWASDSTHTKREDFVAYIREHSTFPIEKQCECDNGSIMFHDIVSFTISAVL